MEKYCQHQFNEDSKDEQGFVCLLCGLRSTEIYPNSTYSGKTFYGEVTQYTKNKFEN